MSATQSSSMRVAIGVAAGLVAGALAGGGRAGAQFAADPGALPGRYQISSFAAPTQGGVLHGAYVVDTTTGQVWQVRSGAPPERVAERLP